MNVEKDNEFKITERTRFSISAGVAWTGLGALVVGVWVMASTLVKIDYKIDGKMSVSQFQSWTDILRERNRTVDVPPVPEPKQKSDRRPLTAVVVAQTEIETRVEGRRR